jgi:hypothetical protein
MRHIEKKSHQKICVKKNKYIVHKKEHASSAPLKDIPHSSILQPDAAKAGERREREGASARARESKLERERERERENEYIHTTTTTTT